MAKKPAKKPVKPVKKAPAKKAAKPAKASKPAAKSKAKPAAKTSASRPSGKVVKPAAKKPAPKPAPKKVVKPVAKKPAAKPAAKPVAKTVAKPVAKAAPKPAPVVAKPTAKPAPAPPKAAAPKPAPKPAPVAAPKPVKKETKKEARENARANEKPLVTQVSAPMRPVSAPVVKKIVSTLERADKLRYADDELEEFRDIINKKLEEARKDYILLKQTLANTDNNGTDDTSPSFKMIEDGSETLSREETAQLAARQEKFIKHLEDALLRIRNKTYGICRVTGRLISKERLRLVPHATLSIEAKQQMSN